MFFSPYLVSPFFNVVVRMGKPCHVDFPLTRETSNLYDGRPVPPVTPLRASPPSLKSASVLRVIEKKARRTAEPIRQGKLECGLIPSAPL